MTLNAKMTELNMDEILGERIKKEVLNVVEKRLNSKNIKLHIENGSHIEGEHFLGKIYRILYNDANDNEKQSSLILKVAPATSIRRKKFKLHNIFLQEINMYEKVLSYFTEFQLSKEINLNEHGFMEYPNYYSSISDEFTECLFLEDLSRRKFAMLNQREEPITFDHMSLLMKSLGKFHAISFALKDQQPEKFNELKNLIPERYWTIWTESELGSFYLSMLKRLTNVLKEEKRFDLLNKFEKVVGDNHTTTVLQLASGAAAEPYAVICHGDVTINNTMYCKDECGKPVDIQIFDWQLSRYASPVIDLVVFLFCSTTKELRDEHYQDFLKIYHGNLCDLLIKLGSDPQKLFPYEALLDQLQKFAVYGAFVGVFLLPILCAETDSMPNVDNTAEYKNKDSGFSDDVFRISNESKRAYNRKVTDMFDDMARLGYI